MLISYVDESGTCETFRPEVLDSTPAFVVVGLHVPDARQKTLTMDFLKLKEEFTPQLAGSKLTGRLVTPSATRAMPVISPSTVRMSAAQTRM